MDVTQLLQLVNAGIIPILLYIMLDDRKINKDLRDQLKEVNIQLLTMVGHTDRLQKIVSQLEAAPTLHFDVPPPRS